MEKFYPIDDAIPGPASDALSSPPPLCPAECLPGLCAFTYEYRMESGCREWRRLRTYSPYECEWNLKEDGEAEIRCEAGNPLRGAFLYDRQSRTLSVSSKRYTVKDFTGNHLELSECAEDGAVRLLTLRKVRWNLSAASVQQKEAGRLTGRWLHAGTYIKDDACLWQPLPPSPALSAEWIFADRSNLTIRYANKSEEEVKYGYLPLNRELFIEEDSELCIDDVYRVEKLSPVKIRLYLMESVDIFPEQCRMIIELERG